MKEEEKGKKEDEMASRKKQREEEERKERGKKRKRVDETRKQQPDHHEKIRASKDEKDTTNEMERSQKKSKDEAGNEAGDDNNRNVSDSEILPRTSRRHSIKDSTVAEDPLASSSHGVMAMNNIDNANQNEHLSIRTSREQSYDISPYKSSDDEDERSFFGIVAYERSFFGIVAYASKNRLAAAVSYHSRLGLVPEVVFPPRNSYSISEVLLPRRLQGK